MLDAPRLAALAVVVREHNVLLVRRRNEPDAGLWGFPGGHVDLGETALEAAQRELHEETAITGHPRGYLTNVDVILRNERGDVEFHFLLAAVLCAYVEGEPIPADDVSDARWVSAEDVLTGTIATSRHVDQILKLALQVDREASFSFEESSKVVPGS